MITEQAFNEFLAARPGYVVPEILKKSPTEYHLLMDFSNDRIVCTSRFVHTIRSLHDNTLNTKAFYGVNKSRNKGKISGQFDRTSVCSFLYKQGVGEIIKAPTELSFEDRYYYTLVEEKGFALDVLFTKIRDMRRPFFSDIIMQQDIYELKYDQAIKFLSEESVDESRYEPEFPFVAGYASVEGYDMATAAKEIKLRREMYIARMSKIETQRLSYTAEILACDDILEVRNIIKRFIDQGFNYGKM